MTADAPLDAVLLEGVARSPDAVLVHTVEGIVRHANAACAVVYGWEPAQLIGSNIGDLVHPDDLIAAVAGMIDFTRRGALARTPGLMRMRRGDGTYGLLEISGNPVEADGHGSRERLIVTFARRAEDQSIMRDATQRLTSRMDVHDFLGFIPQQLRWRHDAPRTVIAWEDDHGHRRIFGDELPAPLTGLMAETDDLSPWRAAWHGEGQGGATDALPTHLAELARDEGLLEYRVIPIESESGRVRALLTLWADERSLPLPMFEVIAVSMTRLISLTLRFAEQQEQLVHNADHDGLTGLVNRRKFYDELAIDVSRLTADAAGVAVLFVDLDGFKPINDTWGHTAGDLVLVEVAHRLREHTRAGDVVARLGGDEFGVLCRRCTHDEATGMATRFLDALREPIDVGVGLAEVHASIGLAVGRSADARSLAVEADEAMYDAKRAGGRRVASADPRRAGPQSAIST